MIVQEIVRYQHKTKQGKDGKPHLITGSEEHRRYILERTIHSVILSGDFEIGYMYKVKGRSPRAQLVAVIDDYKCVKWDGLKVKCMEVWLDDVGDTELFHPSELSIVKRK